jgi:hypothetical protein
MTSFQNPSNLTISTVAPSEEFDIPEITIQSPDSPHFDETSTSNASTDNSLSSTPTAIEPTIFTHKNDTQLTDVFERDEYTTTRTIIRPSSPRSPILSIFSRPSSPLGTVTNLANLHCVGSTDAFEEELDFILQQREKDLAGVAQPIKVEVIQDQAVFYEKKWRDAIQSILFEHPPPMVSCVGHVH